MQPSSLFVFRGQLNKPVCTLSPFSVYHLGICCSTTLPCLLRSQAQGFRVHHMKPSLLLFVEHFCLRFPQCALVGCHYQVNQMIVQRRPRWHCVLHVFRLFFFFIFVTFIVSAVCHNRRHGCLTAPYWSRNVYVCLHACVFVCFLSHIIVINCVHESSQSLLMQTIIRWGWDRRGIPLFTI